MKKFKFSLQTVHQVREFKRDNAERDLIAAGVELDKAKAHLEEVLSLRQKAVNQYFDLHQTSQIEASTVVMHTNYIGSLMELERLARNLIATKERHVASKREVLVEASRQSETTANLRERQFERHVLETARKEQLLLDEMAVLAVARHRSLNS
jgi:flagellar export protein FliJ